MSSSGSDRSSSKGRLALVPTRYGEEVVGGAEAVLREAAQGLAARGWDVEILTTCATSHYTWANEHSAGASTDGAVIVRRFPTVHDGNRLQRDRIERRLQLGLPATLDDELLWLNGGFRVPDLFHYLLAHEHDYRGIMLAPYLFWTTVSAALIAPEKTILMPCLHDENYAYLKVFQHLLSDVGQVWFLSEPEHALGHRLAPLGQHSVTGAGIHVPPRHDAAAGRALARTDRPFIYYGGRREHGKGWDELLGAFTRAVIEHGVELDLVTTGTRAIEPAPVVADRVIDLGLVRDEDRAHLYAAAAAYVQPSRNESFSRTIMEAWLAGTGVIANAASEVVSWHCERSGGGVTYDDVDELVEALVLLSARPGLLDGFGPAGREYVEKEYTWPTVLDRMEAALEQLPVPAASGAPASSRSERSGLPAERTNVPAASGAPASSRSERSGFSAERTNVIVAAPYPTMPGPEARASLQMVRDLLREGADVTVVSPVPSAAHHHADPGGAKGALRLLALARHADRVILRLDAHPLGVSTDSARSLPGRLALAAVIRRVPAVEIILDRVPASVSAQWAKLVAVPADRITVATAGERDALVAAGVDASRVEVASAPAVAQNTGIAGAVDARQLPDSPSAHDVQALIRERAAAATTGASAVTRRASVALRHLPPLERAPVKSQKPAGALVKKLQARVLGWQFDWVIEHLNKLHQATIEAVEGIDDAQLKRDRDRNSS